jgi:hypothetical protein
MIKIGNNIIPVTEIVYISKKEIVYHDIENTKTYCCRQQYDSISIPGNFIKLSNADLWLNPNKIKFIFKPKGKQTEYIKMCGNTLLLNDKSILKLNDFRKVSTPSGEDHYVNFNAIKMVKKENYKTISPEEVNFYMKENNIGENKELYYIFFDDNTFLTVID